MKNSFEITGFILFFVVISSIYTVSAQVFVLHEALPTILVKSRIEDAVVDVTDERALVRYNLPHGLDKDDTLQFVIVEAAKISDSNKIVIQIYENFTPLEEINVDRKVVLDFAKHRITYEEFKQRVGIKPLTE